MAVHQVDSKHAGKYGKSRMKRKDDQRDDMWLMWRWNVWLEPWIGALQFTKLLGMANREKKYKPAVNVSLIYSEPSLMEIACSFWLFFVLLSFAWLKTPCSAYSNWPFFISLSIAGCNHLKSMVTVSELPFFCMRDKTCQRSRSKNCYARSAV